jgi:hypothetical protein
MTRCIIVKRTQNYAVGVFRLARTHGPEEIFHRPQKTDRSYVLYQDLSIPIPDSGGRNRVHDIVLDPSATERRAGLGNTSPVP